MIKTLERYGSIIISPYPLRKKLYLVLKVKKFYKVKNILCSEFIKI